MASQRLGGDQQALVVAGHSGCRQVLIGQLDIFPMILQERHDGGDQRAWLALGALEETRDDTVSFWLFNVSALSSLKLLLLLLLLPL